MKKLLLVSAMALVLSGCDEPDNKHIQAEKANQVAQQMNFSDNAEINGIGERLKLVSQPGLIGYIVLLNESGQPILYTSTKGKPISGGKRLTKPFDIRASGLVVTAPSDTGTWGNSEEYIYFWSTSGQYFQWAGKYLYSDKPFRLDVKPLVISGDGL